MYIPAVLVPGVNVPRCPFPSEDGPVQVPLVEGVPPKELNRLTALPFEQIPRVPVVPALGGLTTVTVVVAVPVQPASVPVTV